MLRWLYMVITIIVLTNQLSLSNDFEPILLGTVQIEGAFIRQNSIHVSMDSWGRIVFPGGNSVVAFDPMSGQ